MSSDNNSNFILSDNSSDSPVNPVDIKSVTVENGELTYNDSKVDNNTSISINDEAGLKNLSSLVNDGNGFNFSTYTVILTGDIEFNEPVEGTSSNFTPIGNSNHKFNGTFDGQGHTITNLKISGVNYAGLFGYLGSESSVKNLGIIGSSISGSSYAGGIAGHNNGGTISNCYNTGDIISTGNAGGIAGNNSGTISNCYNTRDVKATFSSSYDIYAGGIAGQNYSGSISNCYNTGNVEATSSSSHTSVYTGGIAGYNYNGSTISNCYSTGITYVNSETSSVYAGGIAGNNNGTISNCYNTGKVTAYDSSDAYAGGIAGEGYGTISNCYNTGTVEATSNDYNADAGGIVGKNNYGTITNCYNTGTVDATSSSSDSYIYAGGIAGQNYSGSISNCYNTGNVTAYISDFFDLCAGGIVGKNNYGTITNCYNTGNVTVYDSSDAYAGGIAGEGYGTISNCYYLYASGSNSGNGTTSLSKENMINKMLLGGNESYPKYNLNVDPNSKLWSPDIFNINDGYPVLAEVPLEINETSSETSVPPQSVVYIYDGQKDSQAYNFLQPIFVESGGSVTLNIHLPVIKSEQQNSGSATNSLADNSLSYQWYNYDETDHEFKPISNKTDHLLELPLDDGIPGTYRVEITDDEFRYTSSSKTILENPPGKVVVTFDPNCGTPAAPVQVFVDKGNEVSKPADEPEKTGYIFAGWYEYEETDPWDFENAQVTNNITLYANWHVNITITVNLDGKTILSELNDVKFALYQNGSEVQKVTFENNGDGKYTAHVAPGEYDVLASNCKGSEALADTDVNVGTNDNYSATIEYFTVSFDANSHNFTETTKPNDQTILKGQKATKPNNPITNDNYTFECWYEKENGSLKESAWDFNADLVGKTTTLYAKWVYNGSGGVPITPPATDKPVVKEEEVKNDDGTTSSITETTTKKENADGSKETTVKKDEVVKDESGKTQAVITETSKTTENKDGSKETVVEKKEEVKDESGKTQAVIEEKHSEVVSKDGSVNKTSETTVKDSAGKVVEEKIEVKIEDKNTGVSTSAEITKDSSGKTTSEIKTEAPIETKDGKAEVDSKAVDEALKQAEAAKKTAEEKGVKDATPVIEINAEKSKDFTETQIAADDLSKLAEAEVEVKIKTATGEVNLPPEVSKNLSSNKDEKVSLSFGEADKNKLTEEQKKTVGDAPVFEFNLKSGDKDIHDLGGTAKVTVPYELKKGEDANKITVWYLDEEGKPAAMNSVYDSETKSITFETSHFSYYFIAEDAAIRDDNKDSSNTVYYAVAAVIIILIIIALAYYFMKKKQ